MTPEHKPVRVTDKEIACKCGWSSQDAKSQDDAWDQYDEHTM